MNTADFVAEHRITISAALVDSNPHHGMADMPTGSRHYHVALSLPNGAKVVTHFSMGPGLKGTPTASEVLDCLAYDALSALNANNFEDWASDFGYNSDSRKAHATFIACCEIARRLQVWLGFELANELIFQTERL